VSTGIVDECQQLDESGIFPTMPVFDPDEASGAYGYTMLSGVQTRGRGAPKPTTAKREREGENDGLTPEAKRQRNIITALQGTLPPMPASGVVDQFLGALTHMAQHFNIPLAVLMNSRDNPMRAASSAALAALAL
jgi:hypothetical protein